MRKPLLEESRKEEELITSYKLIWQLINLLFKDKDSNIKNKE